MHVRFETSRGALLRKMFLNINCLERKALQRNSDYYYAPLHFALVRVI